MLLNREFFSNGRPLKIAHLFYFVKAFLRPFCRSRGAGLSSCFCGARPRGLCPCWVPGRSRPWRPPARRCRALRGSAGLRRGFGRLAGVAALGCCAAGLPSFARAPSVGAVACSAVRSPPALRGRGLFDASQRPCSALCPLPPALSLTPR